MLRDSAKSEWHGSPVTRVTTERDGDGLLQHHQEESQARKIIELSSTSLFWPADRSEIYPRENPRGITGTFKFFYIFTPLLFKSSLDKEPVGSKSFATSKHFCF